MPKKILITGPESSGKSTLAEQLANQANTYWVPEYARTYLQAIGRSYTQQDLIYMLSGQLRWEQLYRNTTLLFCDTGPEVFHIWSQVKYGNVAQAIVNAMQVADYDHCLLCAPDLSWEADPLREAPDSTFRWELFEQYEMLLQTWEWPYTIITGEGSKRIAAAQHIYSE